MDQKILRQYVRALEQMTKYFNALIEEENKKYPAPLSEQSKVAELTDLRFLARSEKWPHAVPPDTICENEECKQERAAAILQDFIKTDLDDKKFLDFGCGEGHVVHEVSHYPGIKSAVGFDIQTTAQTGDKLLITQNWKEVVEAGPYDVIMVYDVLDHVKDMLAVLNQCVSVKGQFGKIFVRCHPWTSRHGTHLYKELNKAYLHLVFTEDELYAMGLHEMQTTKLLDPLTTYEKAIKEAGLTIVQQELIQQPIEMFFTMKPEILRRIKEKFLTSTNPNYASGQFPREILEIQFIDFTLI